LHELLAQQVVPLEVGCAFDGLAALFS
jgi:hypothetical protein